MKKHTDAVIASCARTPYGLQTLRAHGMPQASLQLVFRTTAFANILPLLGGASQMVARGTDWRVFSDELLIRLLYQWLSTHCGCPLWTGWWTIISCIEIQPYSSPSLTATTWVQYIIPHRARAWVRYGVLPSKITSTDECNFIFHVLYKERF